MRSTYYVAGIPFDGNDALCHYGIIGQKWGVRRFQNKDGTLTAEGRKRYGRKEEQAKLAKKLVQSGGRMDSETRKSINRQVIASSPQVKHAVNQIKELSSNRKKAEKEFDNTLDRDFFNNKKVHDEYVEKGVDQFMKEYGDMVDYDLLSQSISPRMFRGMSKRDIVKWMYQHDDWDQGDCGSMEIFLSSKDPRNANIKRAQAEYDKAAREESKALKSIVNEFLGDYGNQKVKGMYGDLYGLTAGQRLESIISDEAGWQSLPIKEKLANPRKVQ